MDPTTEVALAIHSAPGVYAVLVGSGVSRSAGIPTGWEVTLDLIRQLAVASGAPTPEDPEAWYRDKYGSSPDYSDIVEQLAATPAERQALLAPHFEPNDEERAEGLKAPTAAHEAAAELAAAGAVRVLLTTNFDRLLEQALDAAGVPFDVWASPDAIAGGVPLSHGRVVVIKLHGDYRDTRLRNTMAELDSYDPGIDDLLDRVLDEFGLIICGWSGVWDAALRSALLRAPGRRYRTFWAAQGGRVDEMAQDLIDHRDATVVPIDDADQFFVAVRDKHDALKDAGRPHPSSVELAVAMVKRYLPDERDRIRLADTVMEEARRLHRRMAPDRYPADGQNPTSESAAATARRYEADAETMVHMLAHLGALGGRPDHVALVGRALELILNPEGEWSGATWLLNLRRYPALLSFYATGVSAVAAENWDVLRAAALGPRWHHPNESPQLVSALHPYNVFESAGQVAQLLATGDPNSKRHTPVSDHLHDLLREPLATITDTDRHYEEAFDRFEYLAGILGEHLRRLSAPGAAPGYVGRIRWRYRYSDTMPPAEWVSDNEANLARSLFADAPHPEDAFEAAAADYAETVTEVRKRTPL